jgi:hypothetical protein
MTEEETASPATQEAERREAQQAHVADRAPTADEEDAAERGKKATEADSGSVAEHFEEMSELGAQVKGEGEVD